MRLAILIFFLLQVFVAKACDTTLNGPCRRYDDSGRLVLKAYYKDTLRHGIWTEYDTNGLIIRKTKYKKGHVRWIYIYRHGKIAESIDSKGRIRKRKNCGC